MKQYLSNYFGYNDSANRKLLETLKRITDKKEVVNLFNHLIILNNESKS